MKVARNISISTEAAILIKKLNAIGVNLSAETEKLIFKLAKKHKVK